MKNICLSLTLCILFCASYAQEILPPALKWQGKSQQLIVKLNDPWITVTESSNFEKTPTYDETISWLKKLCASTTTMKYIGIGTSAQGREIPMIVCTSDSKFEVADIMNSGKSVLLAQAGIHAGEIDGKDAGMMLLRDIAKGKKNHLLKNVTLLFIPILNVDGHERSSPYNRVNQRGPSNMGWRTNARNLNLNRDYTKLDTEEIKAVVNIINTYNPSLYLDLHVTDGADYQYDITYGYSQAYSPSSAKWLNTFLSPHVDKRLKEMGHIPGPLLFAANDRDFTEGVVEYGYSARFSNNYGDLIHLPSILVENHSLKPFKQRVLGTYVFLEAVMEILNQDGKSLRDAIVSDEKLMTGDVVLTWKQAPAPEKMTLLGIESQVQKSKITNGEFVQWLGKPVTQEVPYFRSNVPDMKARRPKAYWVPSTYKDVIEKLKLHGIKVEFITQPTTVELSMYKINDYKFSNQPFEGHVGVTAKAEARTVKETFYPGAVKIDLDQPKSDLIMHLLEPHSPDSFLQWGYFAEIFNRTEYIETYAMEPLAQEMLRKDPNLASEFEKKKLEDPEFVNQPHEVYRWFYQRSPYFDSRWLLYPVGVQY
jgi:hypothetical protein